MRWAFYRISIFLDEFEAKKNSTCAYEYHNFNFLGSAEIACNEDPQCIGIYDKQGEGNGPFQLCKYGFFTPELQVSACVYRKKSYAS